MVGGEPVYQADGQKQLGKTENAETTRSVGPANNEQGAAAFCYMPSASASPTAATAGQLLTTPISDVWDVFEDPCAPAEQPLPQPPWTDSFLQSILTSIGSKDPGQTRKS